MHKFFINLFFLVIYINQPACSNNVREDNQEELCLQFIKYLEKGDSVAITNMMLESNVEGINIPAINRYVNIGYELLSKYENNEDPPFICTEINDWDFADKICALNFYNWAVQSDSNNYTAQLLLFFKKSEGRMRLVDFSIEQKYHIIDNSQDLKAFFYNNILTADYLLQIKYVHNNLNLSDSKNASVTYGIDDTTKVIKSLKSSLIENIYNTVIEQTAENTILVYPESDISFVQLDMILTDSIYGRNHITIQTITNSNNSEDNSVNKILVSVNYKYSFYIDKLLNNQFSTFLNDIYYSKIQ